MARGPVMRAGASLGLRIATAVAFGATAALAITLNRGAPVHAALASEKGQKAAHAARPPGPRRRPRVPGYGAALRRVGAAHLGGRGLPGDHGDHPVPARLHERLRRAVHAHRVPAGDRLPGRRRSGRRGRRQGHVRRGGARPARAPGRPRTRPWTPRCPPGAARSGSPGCASSRPASPRPATSSAR